MVAWRYSLGVAALAGCGFPPLVPVPAGPPVEGIEVKPASIRPGDRVTLRDPTPVDPAAPAPLYYWDACEGVLNPSIAGLGPEAVWTAPAAPGLYALTVNIARAGRDRPSLVLPLCVSATEGGSCQPSASAPLAFASLSATPDSMRQVADCGGACASSIEARLSEPADVRFRWTTRRGKVEGAGPSVRWELPTVGCCTETFTLAVTACAADGRAATGFTHVTVAPE